MLPNKIPHFSYLIRFSSKIFHSQDLIWDVYKKYWNKQYHPNKKNKLNKQKTSQLFEGREKPL